MAFILKKLSNKSTLESDGKGGNLGVISGKGKAASVKAWKDEGTIKKGDEIHGIEFTLELADRGNILGQVYQPDTKKFVSDSVPIAYPLKTTLFIPGSCGLAYLKVLSDLDLSKKLELLPTDATTPLIDGFKGILFVGENDQVTAIINDDYAKASHIKMNLFDEFEPVECKLDFAVVSAYGGKGATNQTEKGKLDDRVNFIQAVLTDASPEQQLFVKLLAIDGTITHVDFIRLMFQ